MIKVTKIIQLKELDDNMSIWKGTRFRQYNVDLNVTDKKDDYYEYMLTEIPGEKDFMLLTCVEGYKSGSPLAYVKTDNVEKSFKVNIGEMKSSMGIEGTFMILEE